MKKTFEHKVWNIFSKWADLSDFNYYFCWPRPPLLHLLWTMKIFPFQENLVYAPGKIFFTSIGGHSDLSSFYFVFRSPERWESHCLLWATLRETLTKWLQVKLLMQLTVAYKNPRKHFQALRSGRTNQQVQREVSAGFEMWPNKGFWSFMTLDMRLVILASQLYKNVLRKHWTQPSYSSHILR